MLTIYKTEEGRLHEVSEVQPGCWINLAAPTAQELQKVSEATGALPELLRAALDEEERSHIEVEEDEKQTLILVDIPRVEKEREHFVYSTLPFGIVHCEDYIITVCLTDSVLVDAFANGQIKGLSTAKKQSSSFSCCFIMQAVF